MRNSIISVLMLAFGVFGLLRSENTMPEKKKAAKPDRAKSPVEKELDFIVQHYDSSAFMALYSIEDFKPNSVIAVDKVSRLYTGRWLSPERLLSKLSKDEKDSLLKSTADYLEALEKPAYRQTIMNKLRYWCMADAQFNFMNTKMGVYKDDIIKAIELVPASQAILSRLFTDQSKGKTRLTDPDKEQAYDAALNYICTLSVTEQYKYFSEVFNQLSVIVNK